MTRKLKTNSEGKLAFLDNIVGLYLYRYWPNGTTCGIINKMFSHFCSELDKN